MSDFGELIRRKPPEPKKIIIPPLKRKKLKLKVEPGPKPTPEYTGPDLGIKSKPKEQPPLTREPLNLKITPREPSANPPEPPKRSTVNINIKSGNKPTGPIPTQGPPMPSNWRKRADELRKKVAARDPSLVTKTRMEPPKRTPLMTLESLGWR